MNSPFATETTRASSEQTEPTTHGVFARVMSIKNDLAIVRIENGQEIVWPVSKLPEGVTADSEINLFATTSPLLTEEKLDNEKAKKILELILNG